MPNGLLGDDAILLEARLQESRIAHLPTLFVESYWGDLHDSGLYRPLSLALLSMQRAVFHTDPAPYRIINLILHGLCSILVWRLLSRLVVQRAAFCGALLFAVHPIHAEAVTTIYGQQDLLAAFFFMSALLVAAGLERNRSIWKSLAVGGFYLLSLLCKEQGILLPLFLPMILTRPAEDRTDRWSRDGPVYIGVLVALSIYATLRVIALDGSLVPSGASSVAHGYPWWARVNLAIVTTSTYIRLLIFPWGQTTYYGHLRDSLFGQPWLEGMVLLLLVMLSKPVQRYVGERVFSLSAVFFVVTLLPVANLLPIGTVVAERCLYLPVVAVSLPAGIAIHLIADRRRRIGVALLSTLALAGFLLSARVAVRWRTPLRHWETTAADHPTSAGAHGRLALVLLQKVEEEGARLDDPRLARAEQAIDRAVQLNPRLPEAWQGRGALALIRGDCTMAAAALDRALALRPGQQEIESLRRRCP